MKSVSSVLLSGRVNAGLNLKQIAKDLKIAIPDLERLEQDEWHNYYPNTYLQGMVNKYATYLKLNLLEINALLRREMTDPEIKFIRQKKLETHFISLSTSLYLFIFLGAFFLLFLFQFIFFWQKPLLIINNLPKSIKQDKPLVVEGKTEIGALIYLNDERIFQNEKGIFNEELYLKKGKRNIILRAIGSNGKTEEKTFQVLIE